MSSHFKKLVQLMPLTEPTFEAYAELDEGEVNLDFVERLAAIGLCSDGTATYLRHSDVSSAHRECPELVVEGAVHIIVNHLGELLRMSGSGQPYDRVGAVVRLLESPQGASQIQKVLVARGLLNAEARLA